MATRSQSSTLAGTESFCRVETVITNSCNLSAIPATRCNLPTHTRGLQVRVIAGQSMGLIWDTHGLPMPMPSCTSQTICRMARLGKPFLAY
jgi:hypothetical protein